MLTCLSQALCLPPCTCRCSLGKGALAATHLLAAQEAVEQQLAALKINMEVCGVEALSRKCVWRSGNKIRGLQAGTAVACAPQVQMHV